VLSGWRFDGPRYGDPLCAGLPRCGAAAGSRAPSRPCPTLANALPSCVAAPAPAAPSLSAASPRSCQLKFSKSARIRAPRSRASSSSVHRVPTRRCGATLTGLGGGVAGCAAPPGCCGGGRLALRVPDVCCAGSSGQSACIPCSDCCAAPAVAPVASCERPAALAPPPFFKLSTVLKCSPERAAPRGICTGERCSGSPARGGPALGGLCPLCLHL
jgi:hypothetical protein